MTQRVTQITTSTKPRTGAPQPETIRDVAIIGAGPVGLFSVFACGMMRLSCHLIDALPHTGGQCTVLYPEKPIYDIPAFPEITGADLIKRLEEQIEPFNVNRILGHAVQTVQRTEDLWLLQMANGYTCYAKALVIAGGSGAFQPNKPPLDNLDAFENKSVFYAVQNTATLKGKHLVIAGGGDSAVDWALALQNIAASVTLVHRRQTFRAAPDSLHALKDAMATGKIQLKAPFKLAKLVGNPDQGTLSHIQITSLDGNTTETLRADVLLPFFGLKASLGPIANWGLQTTAAQVHIDPTTAATNIPGIYAVGDMATYPFKRKLIATGFAEAAQAAASIRRQIFPSAAPLLGHSTTTGIPPLGGQGQTQNVS